MVGLVERRLSISALWCRRLALFALPYFALTILMHRFGNITAVQAIGLLTFGFVLLVISIMLAIRAMVQLWNDGAKGGKMMISGLLLSSLMMAPFIVFAVLAVRYPAVNDVSTNVSALPEFSNKTLKIRASKGVPVENDVALSYADGDISAILESYPKISPRRYPAGQERVLEAVKTIVAKRGWRITAVRGLADVEKTPKREIKADKKKKKKSKKKDAGALAVADNGLETTIVNDIYLDAVSLSFVFAFKNDVVVKIIAEENNTLVEMRSAARWGTHDFGVNAGIIERFLADLDQNLLGIAGEG